MLRACTALLPRCPACLLLLSLLATVPQVFGQLPAETAGKGEFPGLQLLPPGSVLKGISLPRYEKHRVASLLMSERMEVSSRTLLLLDKIRAQFYDENGEVTEVSTPKAAYDFARSRVVAPNETVLKSPRVEARGESVVYSTERNVGLLRGPVYSALRTQLITNKASAGQPAPSANEPPSPKQ